jgi:hypothetical protein
MAVALVDLKERYDVLDVREEKNGETIKKHCFNPNCTTFGLLTENTSRFLEHFPEFEIKERGVMIGGVPMNVIERGATVQIVFN